MLAILSDWPISTKTAALLAVLLLTSVAGIRLARSLHVPRVVGYLILGIAAHYILQLVAGGAQQLEASLGGASASIELIKSFTLGLILFTIGLEFDAAHLRAVSGHLWKLTASEILVIFPLVFVSTWAVCPQHSLFVAVILAIAAIETAPAATLMVLRQYNAKGPVTDHILAMTGMNNIAVITLFYIAFLVFAELGPANGGISAEHMNHGLLLGILLATVGSAVLGFLIGLLLSLAQTMLLRFEATLILMAFILVIIAIAKPFGLNSLIMSLFVGVAFTNFSIQPHRLREDLEPLSGPLFALFFVAAGFKLDLSLLSEVGLVGVVFLIARACGKIFGARLGVGWIGPGHRVPKNLGLAMLCQAGVAIGLGKYLMEHWGTTVDGVFVPDPAAASINAVILASVAFFELLGPLATKWTVVRAGEVKAVSLLVRPSGAASQAGTIVRRLRHSLPKQKQSATVRSDNLTARYVMRTNIQSLRENAKMSEVLKFVEHSRLNHFFVVNEDGDLIGTIDFSDLRNLMFNPMMVQIVSAYDMANTAPPVVYADQKLENIMELFHEHDVGSLPVVESAESRRFLGVVEQRDVLRVLHQRDSDEPEEESSH